jgi:hypothetical protein
MNTEPIQFLKHELPTHFARGIEALRNASTPNAKAHLEDVLSARAALRIMLSGAGEAWLRVENGTMTSHDSKPEGVPVRATIEFGADVAREALALLVDSGRMDDPSAPKHFARLFSARAERLLEGQKLEFHVLLRDVPEHDDDIVIKVGIGTDTPPAKPQFTAAISYDDIEDLRDGELNPQQLIGRLRLNGDASRAMALGMMLMQPPSQ